MPILTSNDDDMEQHQLGGGSGFGFSATKIANLGASEYTLFGLAVDVSGSVEPFQQEIEKALKITMESCASSPRADNLMARVITFNHDLSEAHGFIPLSECHPGRYTGVVRASGGTALYDAVATTVDAAASYGKQLQSQDYIANGIIVVITDGRENGNSKLSAAAVKAAMGRALQNECLESLVAVLVGVNIKEPSTKRYLEEFQRDAGFTQFVAIEDASPKALAKLAGFISQSVSSQSQSLGTGGPSQAITF